MSDIDDYQRSRIGSTVRSGNRQAKFNEVKLLYETLRVIIRKGQSKFLSAVLTWTYHVVEVR